MDPNDTTMSLAITMANATNPIRRAQTAILQRPLYCNTCESSVLGTVRVRRSRAPGPLVPGATFNEHGAQVELG